MQLIYSTAQAGLDNLADCSEKWKLDWLIGWLVGFKAHQPLLDNLMLKLVFSIIFCKQLSSFK